MRVPAAHTDLTVRFGSAAAICGCGQERCRVVGMVVREVEEVEGGN